MDGAGEAYAQFERAVILEDEVKQRTAELEHALTLLNRSNAQLAEASRAADAARTDLANAIEALEDQGMQKMLVDLRWNPGGLLQAAKDVSEMFLERGDLIVYTKGRLSQQNMSYYATDNAGRKWKERPLIVLVNGSSASASEILSGAIQDHDIGAIMGQTTFGKGSVQTVFELSRSEALKLTTAAYYTPSGRSIHKARDRDGEEIAEGDLEEADDMEVEETYATDMGR